MEMVVVSLRQKPQGLRGSFSSTQNTDLSYQTLCLITASHRFIEQPAGIVPFLCQEVERISQGNGRLCLYGSSCPIHLAKRRRASLHVTCNRIEYGSLLCFSSSAIIQEDVFLRDMQSLAVACATILYTIEQTQLVGRQDRQDELQRCALLSKKECEVLASMGRGLNQEEIAASLSIRPTTVKTHRQHIFEKLGVKREHDAIMMGYHAGLFSPIVHIVRPEPDWSAFPPSPADTMLFRDNQ